MGVPRVLSDAGGHGHLTRGPPVTAPEQAREARTRSEQSAAAIGTGLRREEQAMSGISGWICSTAPALWALTVVLAAFLAGGPPLAPAPGPGRPRP